MSKGFGLGAVRTDDSTILVNTYLPSVSVGALGFDALQDSDGTDHQVTAGDTFYIGFISFECSDVVSSISLGYADDAAGTNFVPLVPADILGNANDTTKEHSKSIYQVPATKFIVIKNAHGSTASTCIVQASGVEE